MKDKTFKRFKDIKIILFIMMGILFIFTFKLMIVEGNKYREISEEKDWKISIYQLQEEIFMIEMESF